MDTSNSFLHNQENHMATPDVIMIKDLKENQSDIVIEALVLRQGYEIQTNKSSITIRKSILIDKQGTMIYAIMFSNVISQFKTLLHTNKTYLICNPSVKKINSNYVNVNPSFELTVQARSVITEFQAMRPTMPMDIKFKRFNEITSELSQNKDQHIIGFVKNVGPLRTFTRTNTGTIGHIREIVLMNEQYETINIGLWDDLAVNEGQLMKKMEAHAPITAICNLRMQTHYNVSQLKSTQTTYVLLDPRCSAADELTKWLHAIDTIDGVNELWTKKKFEEAAEVTLEQLAKQRNTLTENNYYCVRGTIKKIENNSSLLYDACSHCYKSATKTTSGMSCLDCTNIPIEIVPRYKLTVLIEDGTGIARVTMFGEIVTLFIGRPVEEYIKIRNQDIDDIISHNKENHRFLFKLDKTIINTEDLVSIIAASIQKPRPIHSNNSQTKKQRSLKKLNNASKERSKNYTSSFSKRNIPGRSEVHDTTAEIKDDELLEDYTKRIKRQTANNKKTAAVTTKKGKR